MGTYIAGYFIPKEIVDEIIDLASALEGPEPAMMSDELASLALVQRGWRERAHRHLFESISLRSLARCEKLLHLFATSSGLASYVRRVHIDEGPNDSEEAPWVSQGVPLRQALAMLPNVEALSLARVGFWAADVILSQVPSPFIRTSTLELQFVAVNNLTNLAPYVSALPALRAITIYETTMLHAPADVAAMISGWTPQLDLRPWVHRGVTRLCVRASVSEADDASIQALTLRTVFPSVCEVEVLVVSEYDIDFAATLTRSYGAQLTTIKIDTRGWDEDRCAEILPARFDLSSHTNLRKIDIQGMCLVLSTDGDWVSPLLQQVQSTALAHVHLQLDVPVYTGFIEHGEDPVSTINLDALDWSKIDSALAHHRMLRGISVRVDVQKSTPEQINLDWREEIAQRLPAWRHLLEVTVWAETVFG